MLCVYSSAGSPLVGLKATSSEEGLKATSARSFKHWTCERAGTDQVGFQLVGRFADIRQLVALAVRESDVGILLRLVRAWHAPLH